MSLVVLKSGKIIKESHLGYADLELKTPVNEHSVFSIASMSKTYTAAAILLLEERGKLNLDDKIRKYLPDAPDTWEDITLRMLISHTSGLVDDWGLNNDWENTHKSIFATASSDEEFLRRLYKTPLLFKPGTDFRYGCGTFVLGVVIEKITGKSYAQFMRKEMFEPLGLKETWVDDPNILMPNRVSGYLFENKVLQNGYKLSPTTLARGDVSIRTSARDMGKWIVAINNGTFLNNKNNKLIYERAKLSNGLIVPRSLGGWAIWHIGGNTAIDHGGNYRSGFSSLIVQFVEDDLIVILLTNLADVSGKFRIVQKIASFYNPDFREISSIPAKPKPKNISDAKFEKVIRALATSTIDRSVMSDRFPIAFYSPIKKMFEEVSGIEYLSHRNISQRNIKLFGKPAAEIFYYHLIGKRNRFAAFSLDNEGKILFLDFPETW